MSGKKAYSWPTPPKRVTEMKLVLWTRVRTASTYESDFSKPLGVRNNYIQSSIHHAAILPICILYDF